MLRAGVADGPIDSHGTSAARYSDSHTFDGCHVLKPSFEDAATMAHNLHLSRKFEPAQVLARQNLIKAAVQHGFFGKAVAAAVSPERMLEILTSCVAWCWLYCRRHHALMLPHRTGFNATTSASLIRS